MDAVIPLKLCPARVDWRIVDMALDDGPSSLNPEGLRARFARTLFGAHRPQRLASEALEILRRFSVRAWFWDHIPARELTEVLDAGYSMDDVSCILAYIAEHRGFTPALPIDPV